ncbi:GntR family transcriptional regulator [Streptomyces albus]|uniref:GntR family transcriptional regulator n=1 Tax=Streptomyces albus TaxID=1888 RepID=UPI0004C93906|nr:GntR family transcriptional regulator [Streptomyces albus]
MNAESTPATAAKKRSHLQIADELRQQIHSGALAPGERMPTQAELADRFGVPRGTVRQALRILQDEGLLTNAGKGSPATVADPRAVRDAPEGLERGVVALAPRVAAAFTAPRVRIDALCLTAETLTLAIAESIHLVHAGTARPERIELRLLMPGRNIDLAFPTATEGTDDDRVHERWLRQRNAQGMALTTFLGSLRRPPYSVDVSVRFRALPFTPSVKLYLLNGEEALFGYYLVRQREAEIEGESVELIDTLGMQSMLFPFLTRAENRRNRAFVEQSQLWFDSLWETVSSPLELGAGFSDI